MKFTLALAALFTVALAAPTDMSARDAASPSCVCRTPICPLSLYHECLCKQAAEKECYENALAAGLFCATPVIVCLAEPTVSFTMSNLTQGRRNSNHSLSLDMRFLTLQKHDLFSDERIGATFPISHGSLPRQISMQGYAVRIYAAKNEARSVIIGIILSLW
ncbi:hypothetical protein DE146DRAFT_731831 [Phaeosphaeria sp. MPI-PUGE-AT-0046c]|nr:hypothetical protein DE146DRAFT_731831 [Phaeosphaeria sp. MPI-PUGE-AT-0046c]